MDNGTSTTGLRVSPPDDNGRGVGTDTPRSLRVGLGWELSGGDKDPGKGIRREVGVELW